MMNALLPLPAETRLAGIARAIPTHPAIFLDAGLDNAMTRGALLDLFPDAVFGEEHGKANVRVSLGAVREGLPTWAATEAYNAQIRDSEITITALGGRGVFYATRALRQARADDGLFPLGEIRDWPALEFRGVHMTMGGRFSPSFEWVLAFIDRIADYKINAFVLELDDRFPFRRHPAIAGPRAFTLEQIATLTRRGAERGVEIIPLLDSLGHVSQYLRHDAYADLRERPNNFHEMCASNPATLALMKELWQETLASFPRSRFAHISGDEVFRSRQFCPTCGARARDKTLGGLFRDYYTALAAWIRELGVTPMMWGDMFVKCPDALDGFPRDVVIADWNYSGIDNPRVSFTRGSQGFELPGYVTSGVINEHSIDRIDPIYRERFERYWRPEGAGFEPYPYAKYFIDQGFRVIGATAFSSDDPRFFVASPVTGFANNHGSARRIADLGGMGILNTFWCGVTHPEGAWPGFLAGADYAWHPREEDFTTFGRRVARNCWGIRARSDAATIADKLAESHELIWGIHSLGNVTPEKFQIAAARAGAVSMDLAEVGAAINRNHCGYELSVSVLELERTTKLIYQLGAEMDAALIGKMDSCTVIPLDGFFNRSLEDCSRDSGFALRIGLGPKKFHGAPFQIGPIGPINRQGDAVIVLGDYCRPDTLTPRRVPVSPAVIANRFFFAHTSIYSPGKLGVYRLWNADGTFTDFDVARGRNIGDWGSREILPEAFECWRALSHDTYERSLYVGIFENPRPEEPVIAIELLPESRQNEDHGFALLAITAVVSPSENISPSTRAEFSDRIKALRAELAAFEIAVFDKFSDSLGYVAEGIPVFDVSGLIAVANAKLDVLANKSRHIP